MKLTTVSMLLLAAMSVSSPLTWAEDQAPPRTVPIAVAQVLNQVRGADPATAETLLLAYAGPPHALISLALGNAHLQRSDSVPEAERPALWAAAAQAYAQATQLDPTLVAARLGVARCAAVRGEWAAAVAACSACLSPDTAAVLDLAFFIDCAARAGDSRLAANLVSHAIIRHPGETVFRRQELALLAAAERWEEARAAVLALLAATPVDADIWRTYAGANAHGGSGNAETSRIALEAALLIQPDDRSTRRALAEAQLAAGQAPAALATLQPALADPSTADPLLVELAARAAADADQRAVARTLLNAVPSAKRSRAGLLLAARLAAQDNDLAAADEAVALVLTQGEPDQTVIAWAGSLAERRGDAPRAEALYRQADAQACGMATVRLALLLQRLGRHDEAQLALARYRAAHPDDNQLPIYEQVIK